MLLGICLTTQLAQKPTFAVLFLLGAVGAAASLTKVNVGVFYTVALAHTLICMLQPGRLRALAVGLMLAYAAVMPVLLMRAHFANWAASYCILAVICGFATFLQGGWTRTDEHLSVRHLIYAAVGLLTATIAILSAAILQGVSPYTLLDGIIITPSGHPRLFWIPWVVEPAAVVWAAVAVVSLGMLHRFRRRVEAYSEYIDASRCVVGLAAILLLTLHPFRLSWMASKLSPGSFRYFPYCSGA